MPLSPGASPFDSAWYHLMTVEGGGKYVDNPSDPGGPTRWGVTLRALREWRKVPSLGPGDVATMTEAEAKKICFAHYYVPLGLENCRNVPAAICILDQGYNRGIPVVNKFTEAVLLQTMGMRLLLLPDALNVLATSEVSENRKFLVNFVIGCQKAYVQLAQDRPHLAQFLPGWLNRTHALFRVILTYCP